MFDYCTSQNLWDSNQSLPHLLLILFIMMIMTLEGTLERGKRGCSTLIVIITHLKERSTAIAYRRGFYDP